MAAKKPAKKKVDVKKVQVKDLDAKARKMKLRGGSKSLGRIGRAIASPTQLQPSLAETSLPAIQLE